MWMTPNMKQNAIRYSDILFLDAQKRPFNHFGWPYIGIAIKDGSNRVQVCCEAIVSSEEMDIYEWLIRTMAIKEPRFQLKNIRIIFGDQFLRESLINKLGISSTCTLRCDYWHLMNQFGLQIIHLVHLL